MIPSPMGAQWKQKWREINAHKKGQLVNKLVKELQVAAKLGGPDPDLNARLAAALENARKNSVPKDTIERAVKKGAGLTGENIQYTTITFEGFTPHQVPVIIECLTDNPNRTIPEIKSIFSKGKGQFGTEGSVAWMFSHLGVVEATHENKEQDLEEVAIEAGADEVTPLDSDDLSEGGIGGRFLCAIPSLNDLNQALRDQAWKISTSELTYEIQNPVEVSDDQMEEVADFLRKLDDNDDTHRIYSGLA